MRQDFGRFVSELCALAEAGLTGNDESMDCLVVERGDLYGESYWAGVREGQRVLAGRLIEVLHAYKDLF